MGNDANMCAVMVCQFNCNTGEIFRIQKANFHDSLIMKPVIEKKGRGFYKNQNERGGGGARKRNWRDQE